jgi:large subunit ribosomal protein L24
MFIRKDDTVVVITGDDKSPEPRKVLRVLPEKNKVVVEGVNRVYKHMKPSQRNQQGGRLSKEMPIDVSNVMLYSPSARRGVRVGFRVTEAGQKERFCKVTGASMGTIGPVKPAKATKTTAKVKK